jgi:hypothetical protein
VAKKKGPKGEKAKLHMQKSTGTRERKQALAMWALLGEGGAAYGGGVKPTIEKEEREALLHAGLIEAEKRERGAYWLTVTDAGWDWAEGHLAEPLPERTFGGAFVLQAWLSRLKRYLQERNLRLAEVLIAEETSVEPTASDRIERGEVRDRIRAAYHELAGGFNRRVLLRDLRPKLSDFDRAEVDQALIQMLRDAEATLMQLDFRPDVTDADRAASLQIGNEPRHIIWISK